MHLIFLLACALALPSAQVKPLPSVYVFTDKASDDGALKAREESVKDLKDAFAGRKKVLVLTDNEDRAEVVVEVLERTSTIPKIRIGITPPNSRVPGVDTPMRVVRLKVKVTRGDDKTEFTNKNTPFENDNGWESAAADVAKQIEKWMLAKK